MSEPIDVLLRSVSCPSCEGSGCDQCENGEVIAVDGKFCARCDQAARYIVDEGSEWQHLCFSHAGEALRHGTLVYASLWPAPDVLGVESIDLDDLRPGEETLAKLMVARVRANATMIGGVFAEARVAELLDADFPCFGTSSWDLRTGVLTVQVKASRKGSFRLGATADVWVFVDVQPELDDWRYFVVPGRWIDELGQGSIALGGLERQWAPCAASELSDCVDAVIE